MRFSLPRPPEAQWKRRFILLIVGLGVLVLLVGAMRGGGSTAPATRAAVSTTPTTAPPAPSTTTTVDPKAIQAGVAALLSHEGPTPQQLASVPSSPRAAGGARHGKGGSGHSRH